VLAKNAIWAPSHNFVGLYLRNEGTYRQQEKNLLNSNVSPHVLTIWWTSAYQRLTALAAY